MSLPFVVFTVDDAAAELCDVWLNVVDQAVALPRTPGSVEHKPVAPLVSPAAAPIYAAIGFFVALAAPLLGIDDPGNWIYGKVIEYGPGDGGIHWHADNDTGLGEFGERYLIATGQVEAWQFEETKARRIACFLQCSEPSDYEAGDLELLKSDGSVFTVPREKGTIVIAPADVQHRVTPVAAGCRLSCVVMIGNSPRAGR